MLFTIFIIVAILLGLALVGLGINILFRKNGKFPETHIGKNKAMKDRGIHCANTTDRLDRQNYKPVDLQPDKSSDHFPAFSVQKFHPALPLTSIVLFEPDSGFSSFGKSR